MEVENINKGFQKIINDQKQQIDELTLKLEIMTKTLDSLSYSISHDLKAPLRAISGFSHLLFEDYESKLDLEGKHFLNSILRNVDYMGQQIDDILKFSRVGSDTLYMEEIDTFKLVNDVAERYKNKNLNRSIKIEIEDLPNIYGDKTMFQKVFSNILSNAFKFTRYKDVSFIKIGCQRDSNENTFYVKDNGVGFDMKYSGKLFALFQRLHTEDEFEGLGAGLAITQRIIQRHGGRNWLESEINIGTTFNFSLPTIKT